MISKRKEKKLLARGNRIQKVAMRHLEVYRATQKVTKINRTSEALADVYSGWEMQAIDYEMLVNAY